MAVTLRFAARGRSFGAGGGKGRLCALSWIALLAPRTPISLWELKT